MIALRHLALLGALAGVGLGQDCPILGPAYPEVTNPGSSAAFTAAKTAFESEISKALASGQLDNGTTFAIQVFSRNSDKTLYEQYHGAVGPETLYRIASISKVMSVYTTLAELGDKYWNDPVTKYVPELACLKVQNPVYNTDWSEVTLGSLASHMGGIARDYALGDLAAYAPQGLPGLPVLNQSRQMQCGTGAPGVRGCTREETFAKIAQSFPISPSFHTPAYSNMAFQLLGYAVEKITKKKFSSLVDKNLVKRLKLTRTFVTKPTNDSNALILDGWDTDFGEEAPGAGYYSCANDLTTLGRSILSSSLLPPLLTRQWLKPITHTASLSLSIGRPWEIMRLAVPVSAGSPTTRVVDLYTKQGATGQYQTLLALSPDHGVGYAMLVGGPQVGASYNFLQAKLNEVFIAAAEQAGREQAEAAYGGNYTLAGDGSAAEFVLRPGEPGLLLTRLVSNGTDIVGLVGPLVGVPAGVKLGVWLYPVGLAGKGKVAFRAAIGVLGLPAGEACAAWGSLDNMRYGGFPADLFIFELGKDGKAVGVEVPVLQKTLKRSV